MKLFLLTALYIGHIGLLYSSAQGPPNKVDIKTFVTRVYIHGLPYDEAKRYDIRDLPPLFSMLKDPTLESYWGNIVMTIGYIGSPSATKPLLQFVQRQEGEISVNKFRAVLCVFQALGHIAQSGDKASLNALSEYNSLSSWKSKNLRFSYNSYKNEALSEVLSRQAIQGLGISGRPEAFRILSKMNTQRNLRSDWVDNVSEALILNEQVKTYGAKKIFGKEQQP